MIGLARTPASRLGHSSGGDLLAQVRRCVEKRPGAAVAAHRHRGLRACTAGLPFRASAQLRQLQLICGKPPPAEEPRTLISMEVSPELIVNAQSRPAIAAPAAPKHKTAVEASTAAQTRPNLDGLLKYLARPLDLHPRRMSSMTAFGMICWPLKNPPSRIISPKRARSRSVRLNPPPANSTPDESTVKYASSSTPSRDHKRSVHQLAECSPGDAAHYPGECVGVDGLVGKPLAVRRFLFQRFDIAIERVRALIVERARSNATSATEMPDRRGLVDVILGEPQPSRHVEDVPNRGAGIARSS